MSIIHLFSASMLVSLPLTNVFLDYYVYSSLDAFFFLKFVIITNFVCLLSFADKDVMGYDAF